MRYSPYSPTIRRRRGPPPKPPEDKETQELLDRFYWSKGPCCAGCDWWRALNSLAGECQKSAPVSGATRASMLGVSNCSLEVPAGHALTWRDHHCGDFKDEFDWSTLPLNYLARIGAPSQCAPGGGGE